MATSGTTANIFISIRQRHREGGEASKTDPQGEKLEPTNYDRLIFTCKTPVGLQGSVKSWGQGSVKSWIMDQWVLFTSSSLGPAETAERWSAAAATAAPAEASKGEMGRSKPFPHQRSSDYQPTFPPAPCLTAERGDDGSQRVWERQIWIGFALGWLIC